MVKKDKQLDELINSSAATEDFKAAVRTFEEGLDPKRIRYSAGSPRIKVLRVIMNLLESFPDEPITEVRIEGVSSCSGYEGTLTYGPSETKIAFNWDCNWKAQQEKMVAWYGMPDQTKAAQVFGHRCFERFERV